MGRDKATMTFRGKPLIAHIYDVVRDLFPHVSVISSYHESIHGLQAPILKDFIPRQGPLVGIVSALLYSSSDYTFIVGCDMPFIRRDVITYMIEQVRGEDVVIPKTEKGYEPLHSLYNRSCLAPMLNAIERGAIGIRQTFPFLSVRVLADAPCFVRDGLFTFTNVNTEEELSLAERLIE
jgi:molybdenum cofactor guanylyltransferase